MMITDENVKVCKDCKWYKNSWIDPADLSMCSNPRAKGYRIEPVTGTLVYAYCDIERRKYIGSNNCGPDADFFEPKTLKKNIWSRLFGTY